jgi:hypothetical protein
MGCPHQVPRVCGISLLVIMLSHLCLTCNNAVTFMSLAKMCYPKSYIVTLYWQENCWTVKWLRLENGKLRDEKGDQQL